jgi:hypothetical protein
MSNVALPAILHLKFFMELGTIKNVTYESLAPVTGRPGNGNVLDGEVSR